MDKSLPAAPRFGTDCVADMTERTSSLAETLRPGVPLVDWRRPDRSLRLWGRMIRVALRARQIHGGNLLAMMRRARILLGRDRFAVSEILQLGLLQPALDQQQLRAFQSRFAATEMERLLNPESSRSLVEDKAAFYRRCAELKLPSPRLVGVYFQDRPGWTFDGRPLEGLEQWEQFLRVDCPAEMVIKPSKGGYGEGVRLWRRDEKGMFHDQTGRELPARELLAAMPNPNGAGAVIQERATSHPELATLSGTHNLQTTRIITMLDPDGTPHCLHAHLKVIVGDNFVDNFHYGATGNLLAPIDLETGRLAGGRTLRRPEGGFALVERHPSTGVPLAGIQVPQWDEVLALARRAAIAFQPLRYVGWDIALTPTGPVLVEGNWNSDPPNPSGRGAILLAAVERLY